jgi:hypothetical protein
MAYPAVDGPYGLVPVGLIGGQVYAGAIRQIPIASAYATSIFNGDVVKLVADGTLEKDTGTTAATPVGVFLGCSYTDTDIGFIQRNYFPADTVASDIVAYVCDDPDAVFKVAVVSGTTVIAGVGRTAVGANASIVQNAGISTNGKSQIALLSTSLATTATLPLRVIDVVKETADSSGNYTELLVKWNAGHQYANTTGLA